MTRDQLFKEIQAGTVRNLYLFYGEEDFLIHLYTEQIRDIVLKNDPSGFNLTVFEGDGYSNEDIMEAIETYPILSERKLIILEDTKVFKSPGELKKSFWEETLPQIPDYVTVIFCEEAISKVYKKLIGAVEKNGAVVELKHPGPGELQKWINRQFAQNGKKISVANIDHIIDLCPPSMEHILREVEKICSYVGEKEVVSKEDIEAIITPSAENRIFELTDAIFGQNPKAAFAIYEDLKLLKETPYKIISILGKNFSTVYKIKVSKDTAGLKMHPYVIKKYTAIAKKTDLNRLRSIMKLCEKCDISLKSSPVDEFVLFEIFLSEVFGNIFLQ